MTEPTRFTAVEVKETVKGALVLNELTLSKADDYALTSKEKFNGLFKITATAASKTVTLGLPSGQVAIVKNAGGTNAFTVKNVAADTGTSLAAGKSLLIVASPTTNASTVIALD